MSLTTSVNRGAGVLAAAVALGLAAPAGASAGAGIAGSAAARSAPVVHALSLRAMPAGTVVFGRQGRGRLTARAEVSGLTPGSSHEVDLVLPGRLRAVRFSLLTANGAGQANSKLHSNFTGRVPRGSRLLVRMGAGGGRVAREPIAETRRLRRPGRGRHRLVAVEVSPAGVGFGTPRGRATISYSGRRHTLTVTVHASGLTPGRHAIHVHLGSCRRQGPVIYMVRDLVASRHGRIAHAVRVVTNVTTPIPAHGWYLNIHQGNSGNILRGNGQPTIFFRPLLCADIRNANSR